MAIKYSVLALKRAESILHEKSGINRMIFYMRYRIFTLQKT
jgi:hypothetical protein